VSERQEPARACRPARPDPRLPGAGGVKVARTTRWASLTPEAAGGQMALGS